MINKILTFVLSFFAKKAVQVDESSIPVTDISEKELGLYEYIKQLYAAHGGVWEEVNIFGLRDIRDREKDVWNDWIGVATMGKVYLFQATVDPGVYYTKIGGMAAGHPGVANICLGWYPKVYRVGFHGRGNYRHEALIQVGKLKIWRDGNRNFRRDNNDITVWGWFATNIHRAAAIILEKIGRYSAGCLVIRKLEDHLEFMKVIKGSGSYKKSKRYRFGCLLLNVSEVPENYLEDYKTA